MCHTNVRLITGELRIRHVGTLDFLQVSLNLKKTSKIKIYPKYIEGMGMAPARTKRSARQEREPMLERCAVSALLRPSRKNRQTWRSEEF